MRELHTRVRLNGSDLIVSIFDITDVNDAKTISEIIDLVKIGQNEEVFSCVPDMSYESTIAYKSRVKIDTNSTYRIYAAFDNRFRIIGFIDFGLNLTKCEIYGIIINPEYRGLGIGRLLLEVAERSIREDFRVTLIETEIFESNEISKKFFSKQGYFYTGEKKFFIDGCGKERYEEVWRKYMR